MKKSQIIFTALIIIININLLNAEWKKTFGLSSYYNENPFRYTGSIPLTFNSTNLNIGYVPENSEFQYNYTGIISVIPQLSYCQLSDNLISLSYLTAFSDEQTNNLMISANSGMKLNSGDFTSYNNSQFGLSSTINHSISETSVAKIGFKSTYKNYYNNIDLSYSEHQLYLGYRKYFESETSLITEIDYGYKNLSSNIISIGGKGSGKASSQSLGQVIANIKVAQSIAEKTGLSLIYSQSWNTSADYKNMLDYNPDVIFEKEIYDDTYSYESQELTLTITQYLNSDIKLQVYGYYFNKNYQYGYDFSNGINIDKRKDVNSGFGLNFEKNIDTSFIVFDNAILMLNYLYNKNYSNSEYFNFQNNEISFGVKFGF